MSPIVSVSAAPPLFPALLNIRKMSPARLSMTPPAFFKVMGSLRTIAAMNIVKIGDRAVTIEQSIGVMWAIPFRKVSCVSRKLKTDAPKIFKKSCFSTLSLRENIESIQNAVAANTDLKLKIASGESQLPLVRSLQMMMLRPKIEYAKKQARCPADLLLTFISKVLSLYEKEKPT